MFVTEIQMDEHHRWKKSKTKSFKTDYRKMSKTVCKIMAGKKTLGPKMSTESWKATKLQTESKTIKNQNKGKKNNNNNTKAFSCTLYVPDIFKQ